MRFSKLKLFFSMCSIRLSTYFQVPQYLHEAGWSANGFTVGVTQPRRVAATTVGTVHPTCMTFFLDKQLHLFICMQVASRVAEERGAMLGLEVRTYINN